MSLKHVDIWRAIDRLAEQNNLSPSGLARKAGLSPTLFNPSKRFANKRARWPSTESIAHILKATNSNIDDFVALATSGAGAPRLSLPVLELKKAAGKKVFSKEGLPTGAVWDAIPFPALGDPQAFMLEISGKIYEPFYRDGTYVVLSPHERMRRGDRVAVRTTRNEILLRELGRETMSKIDFLSLDQKTKSAFLRSEIEWIYRILWASQ
jgi:phage repressor protein C with HTH and peptisase S24 domain